MDGPALAQLEHENWISYLAASVAFNPEGVVQRERGIVALLGHVPLRFFNQILVVDGSAADVDAIRGAVALARERDDLFAVSLREGLDDGFTPLMTELGLAASDEAATHAMGLHPVRERPRPAGPGAGLEIRRVTNAAELADHRRAVSGGFESDPAVADAILGIGLLDRPEGAVYVGYLDGEPVTSGLGWQTGRTIGVYNIATIPSARRRGFGEAMTARVLADGEAAGCHVAILQASPMGQPIYERLGFRTVVRYTGYVDAAHPSAHGGAGAG